MSFPDLVEKTGGVLHSEATGVPDNGNNTFALGLDPEVVDEDWLELEVDLGGSVTDAAFVSMSPDKTQITMSFVQGGVDAVTVRAKQKHTIVR